MNWDRVKDKVELITNLHSQRQTEPCKLTVYLAMMLIDEIREQNDFADVDTFKINQGKIAGLKLILDAITTGVPQRPQKTQK